MREPDAKIADMIPDLRWNGREWIGPCPQCGGEDRFSVTPTDAPGGGLFFCRGASVGRAGCDWGGDGVTLLVDYYGYEKKEALAELGVERGNGDANAAWKRLQERRRKEEEAKERRLAQRERLRALMTEDELEAYLAAGRLDLSRAPTQDELEAADERAKAVLRRVYERVTNS